MATSEAELINLAFLRIGEQQYADSLEGPSPANLAAKQAFAHTKQLLFDAFDWSFLRKEATLSLVAGEDRAAWAYVYAAPADMLRPRRIANGYPEGFVGAEDEIPYEEELRNDGSGRLILTNEPDAVLEYIRTDAPVPMWTPAFADAFVVRLALNLAAGVAIKEGLSRALLDEYRLLALPTAMARDARRHHELAEPDSRYQVSRR